jgi:hypothetical protein
MAEWLAQLRAVYSDWVRSPSMQTLRLIGKSWLSSLTLHQRAHTQALQLRLLFVRTNIAVAKAKVVPHLQAWAKGVAKASWMAERLTTLPATQVARV